MDLIVAGRDHSAADQPSNLAEGHPLLPHCNCNHYNHYHFKDNIWHWLRPVLFLQTYVYFTLVDPAMPISPTYVAAGYSLCKPFVNLLFVAGRDQSAADQPSNLAEGHPLL
jgi:hypothetical protein